MVVSWLFHVSSYLKREFSEVWACRKQHVFPTIGNYNCCSTWIAARSIQKHHIHQGGDRFSKRSRLARQSARGGLGFVCLPDAFGLELKRSKGLTWSPRPAQQLVGYMEVGSMLYIYVCILYIYIYVCICIYICICIIIYMCIYVYIYIFIFIFIYIKVPEGYAL